MKKVEKIGIVGAGLVGSMQAVYMARKGYEVHVFERRPDLREAEFIGGRSINLALSDRGWKALRQIDLEDKIKAIALPMKQRCMHDMEGNYSFQPYGVNGECIYSVSRGKLNQILMNEAKNYPNIHYHFNHKTKDVDLRDNTLVMQDLDKKTVTFRFDKLFACDGAFSAVRSRMMRTQPFNYSQEYLTHGYKELEIPALENGVHRLSNDALHIWPRGEFMMIALPNLDGSFTCTLFFPMEGVLSFESLSDAGKVETFFKQYFPDALDLMPELTTDFFSNATGHLVTIKCSPWQVNDDVLLLGDAAHAIVPFYGQGMNAGFEDCSLFSEWYDKREGNWDGLLSDFSDFRYKDGHAIADLAVYNYLEMRDKTADPDFLLRKKIEAKFAKLHPEFWMPLYSMVTFSDLPYHQALERGNKQRAIMDEVMSLPDIHARWNESETMEHILRLLYKSDSYA